MQKARSAPGTANHNLHSGPASTNGSISSASLNRLHFRDAARANRGRRHRSNLSVGRQRSFNNNGGGSHPPGPHSIFHPQTTHSSSIGRNDIVKSAAGKWKANSLSSQKSISFHDQSIGNKTNEVSKPKVIHRPDPSPRLFVLRMRVVGVLSALLGLFILVLPCVHLSYVLSIASPEYHGILGYCSDILITIANHPQWGPAMRTFARLRCHTLYLTLTACVMSIFGGVLQFFTAACLFRWMEKRWRLWIGLHFIAWILVLMVTSLLIHVLFQLVHGCRYVKQELEQMYVKVVVDCWRRRAVFVLDQVNVTNVHSAYPLMEDYLIIHDIFISMAALDTVFIIFAIFIVLLAHTSKC